MLSRSSAAADVFTSRTGRRGFSSGKRGKVNEKILSTAVHLHFMWAREILCKTCGTKTIVFFC